MKPPHDCSIPHLLDIDPFEEFEFSFPCEEPWWDDFETDTSDYFSDSDSDYSTMFDTSFTSEFYVLSPNPNPESTSIFNKEENEICRRSPGEKDVLIQKTISTINHVAPSFVYKRRKAARKRRKYRRRRKQITAVLIEPELRSLWHSSVGDLFAPPAVTIPKTPPSLPTINLNLVNRAMLRRLPEVVSLPIHSCSEKPEFYTKVVCQNYATKYTSTPTPLTQHQREKPFGSLPGIETDLGAIPPPDDAAYGYVWTDGAWRVKAERARVPDPGGGHQRGRGEEDRGGRDGEAERRGRMQKKVCER